MSRYELAWVTATVIVLAAILTVAIRPPPLLVWNVSRSAPVGLYLVSAGGVPQRGAIVIARLPVRYRSWAAARGYVPVNVPLVKRVAAVRGARICGAGTGITVAGRVLARRLILDRRRRPLPTWQGCVVLKAGEVFLLNYREDSFDGRYFGVTKSTDLIGTAKLLWRA